MIGTSFNRRRVLFVTHNIAGRQPYGGVEIYQDILKDGLRDSCQILTLVRGPSPESRLFELIDEDGKSIDSFPIAQPVDEGMLRNVEVETIFCLILRRYDIELVHFQHLIGFVPSLPILARALGARVVFSAHDYYAICKNFNLLDGLGELCLSHFDRLSRCDTCLFSQSGIPYGAQRIRRNAYADMLRHVDGLLFPSNAARDIFARIYPYETERLHSVVIGQPTVVEVPAAAPVLAAEPLKLAVYGNFSFNKGGDILVEAFRALRKSAVEFHLFGRVDRPYDDILEREQLPNLTIHGPFAPGQPPKALCGMDCSLHLSNWPETYCMTLSEAWQIGLVPIVSDIGALGERVTHGVNGFKVPPKSAKAVINLIQELAANPDRIRQVRSQLSPDLVVSPVQHCGVVEELYRSLCQTDLPQDDTTSLAGSGLERPDISKVATLEHLGLGFLPDRWWSPPHAGVPAPISSEITQAALATIMAPSSKLHLVRKFLSLGKRYGMRFAFQQAWLYLRLRMLRLKR